MEKSKKGVSSHVEIMISFIIFISFVVFILMMFRPVKLFSKISTSLDMAESGILEYVSTNLSVTSLILNFTPGVGDVPKVGDCLYFNFSVKQVIIKDEDGNTTNSNSRGNKEIYFNATEKKFYKIYSEKNLVERKVDNGKPKICTELNE